MTPSMIDTQPPQQPEQDERLLCIRVLYVDSDEVNTTSHYYAIATKSTAYIVGYSKLLAMCGRSRLLLTMVTSLSISSFCAVMHN
eukprot:3055-Heterococcus_DN1.PRE.1